jgi:hypothetical protein
MVLHDTLLIDTAAVVVAIQAIQKITDKLDEIQVHRRTKLNGALLMERKKHCDFFGSWCKFVDAQITAMEHSKTQLQSQRDGWVQLSNTQTQLCAASKQLLAKMDLKERTALSIEDTGDEAYDEGYEGYDESYDEAYDESYDEGQYICQAQALYDYSGTHDYELNFSAGDIINVTAIDEATGWWTGTLNGVVGPFPGNYVRQL